jgi:hypothetical protein
MHYAHDPCPWGPIPIPMLQLIRTPATIIRTACSYLVPRLSTIVRAAYACYSVPAERARRSLLPRRFAGGLYPSSLRRARSKITHEVRGPDFYNGLHPAAASCHFATLLG